MPKLVSRCILASMLVFLLGCGASMERFEERNEYKQSKVEYEKPLVLPSDLREMATDTYYPIPEVKGPDSKVSTLPPGSNIKRK